MKRHNNIMQRALSLRDDLGLCFIADGIHIPFFALKNYLRAAGLERSIVVTDAIALAGLGPEGYTQGSIEVKVGEDMVARAPDSAGGAYLAGAVITLPQTIANLRTQIGLNTKQIERITHGNPRRAIGL